MGRALGDIGVIGLGVMGQNLVLNINDRRYRVAAYNRTVATVDEFLRGPARDTGVLGVRSLEELASALKKPRKVLLMVKAGEAVDGMIDQLLPILQRGDLIMDGGNSHFKDTMRRAESLAGKGLLYLGVGISGGEEGARHGPSIMAGGSSRAWPLVREILQGIAARTVEGAPCCDWLGENGAGHYVKMVHNGIEYSEMQLLCEAYHLMKDGLGLSHDEMHETFARWNRGVLQGYLVEITAEVLSCRDERGRPLVEIILDVAGQKGTGGWSSASSFELGVPLGSIGEAVYARFLSGLKEDRLMASRILRGPNKSTRLDRKVVLEDLRKAILASKVVSYAQGFMLMRAASAKYAWGLDSAKISLLWQNGCILRNALLGRMRQAFTRKPDLPSLLLDPYFRGLLWKSHSSLRRTVARAVGAGIPVPVFSSTLAFHDGYRTSRLPANLLQAQRDYFGAHTFERVDRPRGQFFHAEWKGVAGAGDSHPCEVQAVPGKSGGGH